MNFFQEQTPYGTIQTDWTTIFSVLNGLTIFDMSFSSHGVYSTYII